MSKGRTCVCCLLVMWIVLIEVHLRAHTQPLHDVQG